MPYKNKEDEKEHSRQYYIKNKKRIYENSKQYQLNHPEKTKEYRKRCHIKNKEKDNEQTREYYQKHREEMVEAHAKWYQDHKKERNKYQRDKRKTDLKYNLNRRMSAMVRNSLRGNKNGQYWEDLIGYTLIDLIKHLKKTIPDGYNWQDCLNGRLHIDHIIPISAFNFSTPKHVDFKRCWALENLRLLPAEENLRKNNKLFRPFQPALAI